MLLNQDIYIITKMHYHYFHNLSIVVCIGTFRVTFFPCSSCLYTLKNLLTSQIISEVLMKIKQLLTEALFVQYLTGCACLFFTCVVWKPVVFTNKITGVVIAVRIELLMDRPKKHSYCYSADWHTVSWNMRHDKEEWPSWHLPSLDPDWPSQLIDRSLNMALKDMCLE